MSDLRVRWARVVVIGVVVGAAVGTTLTTSWNLVRTPELLGLDLSAYLAAAVRLAQTGSPYADELRSGPIRHVSENIQIAYLYPPVLAQIVLPLTILPRALVDASWALVQALILAGGLTQLTAAYYGRLARPAVAVALLAAAAFQPTQIALYIGNVSGWIAIGVVALLVAPAARRGWAASTMAWVKIVSGGWAVGTLLERETRFPTLFAGVAILLTSVVLAPSAWVDFLKVLPSLMGTQAADTAINVAPSRILALLGMPMASAVITWMLPAVFFALLVWNAVKGRRLPWVASAAGVYLTGTATTWHQYLVVLVPIAAATWPMASLPVRATIVGGWLMYSVLWWAYPSLLHQVVGTGLWLGFLMSVALSGQRVQSVARSAGPLATRPI